MPDTTSTAETRLRALRRECTAHSLTWRGASLRYLSRGAGPCVLLVLPGAVGGPELALLQLTGLPADFRVIAPAHPPFVTMAALADSLDAILAHAGVDRVHLLGKSYGGLVAQVFVRAHPARVASLALFLAAPPDRTRVARNARMRTLMRTLPWPLLRSLALSLGQRVAQRMPSERPFWAAYLRETGAQHTRDEALALQDRVIDYDAHYAFTPGDLGDWNGRVLVMDSDDDPIVAPSERAALRRLYPDARRHTFYRTQHSASMFKPREFIGVLEHFLAGDRDPPAAPARPIHVVFIPLVTEVGHLNPTLAIAHDLVQRGHRASYLAMPELLPHAHRQGFPGTALFTDLPQTLAPGGGWFLSLPIVHAMREVRMKVRHFNTMLDRMLSGEVAALMQAAQPTVVAVDNMWPQLAFVARSLGVPAVLLSTTPEFRADDARRSSITMAARMTEALLRFMLFVFGLRLHRKTSQLARQCAIENVDTDGVLPRQVGHEIPELLLYPRELDDPGANPGRYVGPLLDVARSEPPLDFGDIPEGDTVVYCALGSRQTPAPQALALFRPIIAAVSQRPKHTLILAAGEHAGALGTPPANVRIVSKAPQLAVLQRASVMLTHGGLGSIKESLYYGVPMLVFPLRFDQGANAKRVHERQLGLQMTPRDRTAEGISRALDELTTNPVYRERVAAMSTSMRELQSEAAATEFFLSLAARPEAIYG